MGYFLSFSTGFFGFLLPSVCSSFPLLFNYSLLLAFSFLSREQSFLSANTLQILFFVLSFLIADSLLFMSNGV